MMESRWECGYTRGSSKSHSLHQALLYNPSKQQGSDAQLPLRVLSEEAILIKQISQHTGEHLLQSEFIVTK